MSVLVVVRDLFWSVAMADSFEIAAEFGRFFTLPKIAADNTWMILSLHA